MASVPKPAVPFEQARHYHPGRISERIDVLVIHSADGATTAKELGDYFATTDREASAHYGVSDTDEAQYVHYDDTAFAAPGANSDGEHIELCGQSGWSRAQWLEHKPMLTKAAAWVRARAAVHNIPLVHLGPAALKANKRGIAGHVDVTNAFHLSTHTDPGEGFPWDVFLALVHSGSSTVVQVVDELLHGTRKPPAFPGVMEVGSHGPHVLEVQRELHRRGLYRGKLDGLYGPITEQAVKQFEVNYHRPADGIAGPTVWKLLFVQPLDR